jgi:hypothetical protein
VQPTNHRPSGEADEPVEQDAIDGAFDPGDSFSNDSSDQAGAGDLPAWLQNFADVASEQTGGKPAAAPTVNPAPAASSQAQPAPDAESILGSFGEQPVADAGFFSDDDLPEWLRALSTDSEPAAGADLVAAAPALSPASNGALQVPPVSRAWVTHQDQPEVSPGANLLASLVHVIDSRPDAVAVPAAAGAGASAPVTSQSVATPPKPPAAEAQQPEPSIVTPGWGRMRVLLIAAIILIVFLIIVMVLGN